jgi:DNA-binding response OmpR family regulator
MDQARRYETPAVRRRTSRTILAAGPERRTLGTLAQALGGHGHLVVLSEAGSQALELIAARDFDLVLLDVDGDRANLHVLGEVRGARDTADLPVVLIASPDAEREAAAFAAGADDWLAKPLDPAVLMARVERVLARAGRVAELKRSNLALDARIAARAIELGEARAELAALAAEHRQLAAALETSRRPQKRNAA